jgi:hypothetical protein
MRRLDLGDRHPLAHRHRAEVDRRLADPVVPLHRLQRAGADLEDPPPQQHRRIVADELLQARDRIPPAAVDHRGDPADPLGRDRRVEPPHLAVPQPEDFRGDQFVQLVRHGLPSSSSR